MVILTINKIILYFITLKLLNGILFFISGLMLYKLINYDRRILAMWFLNPFLIIELLSNSHNDMVMIAFFIIGFFYFTKKKYFSGLSLIIFSILTKFVSLIALPILFLNKSLKINYIRIVGITLPILTLLLNRAIEPWYLSWSYMFLPMAKLKTSSWILFSMIGFIKLANYYRFLESSGWGAGLVISHPMLITNILIGLILIIEYRKPIGNRLKTYL